MGPRSDRRRQGRLRGRAASSTKRSSAAPGSPRPTRARWHRWTGPGCARRCSSSARFCELVDRAGPLRDAVVHDRHRRPGARRPAAEGSGARDHTRDTAPVLRARMGRARRRSGGGAALRRRRSGVLRAPPAQRPPLPPAPALRARGKVLAEKSVAASASWARLFGEVVSAIRVDRRRRGGPARPRAERTAQPRRASGVARTARGDHRGARAGPAYARVHLQHARV